MSIRPGSRREQLRAWAERDGRGYPDWLMRYGPVVRRLGPMARNGACVVEIGANEAGLARFANARTVVMDRAHDHLVAARDTQPVMPVQADIARLPFAAGSVEVLICLDTFEHLPDSARQMAVSEITRCLAPSGRAVVSFPSGEAAMRAEERVRRAYQALTGQPLRWLEEHIEQGLPDAEALRADFEQAIGASHTVSLRWNANAAVWTWMWRVLMCNWPGRGNVIFQVLLRIAAPVLARCHFGQCYRAMLWLEPRVRP